MDLWKDIPNFEGLYQASINGKIRSIAHIRKSCCHIADNYKNILDILERKEN